MLASEEISYHKKLCIQLKRSERKVLQNALKFAAVLKNKNVQAQPSDMRAQKGNLNVDIKDTSPKNMNGSIGIDETSAAVDQLDIEGE